MRSIIDSYQSHSNRHSPQSHSRGPAARAAALLAALVLCLTAGCGGASDSQGTDAAGTASASQGADASSGLTPVTFMLSWVPDTNHIGVYVAAHNGYYKDAGLDVTIVGVSQSGAEQAVESGAADFTLSTMTNVAVYSTKGATLRQVMQTQVKPSAIWCALASNTAIKSPRDFDGKTFATFGSSEADAVIRAMIRDDGGQGEFDKVTVGTSTFQTLESGRADFGGFYDTWEGVQSRLNGPALTCFTEPDYGVPGNADSQGIVTTQKTIDERPDMVRAFTQATQKGYDYAYAHPDEASQILVDDAPDAGLDLEFVRTSMDTLIDGSYWGDQEAVAAGTATIGAIDYDGDQKYLDFLADNNAFEDADGNVTDERPQARNLATEEFLAAA